MKTGSGGRKHKTRCCTNAVLNHRDHTTITGGAAWRGQSGKTRVSISRLTVGVIIECVDSIYTNGNGPVVFWSYLDVSLVCSFFAAL